MVMEERKANNSDIHNKRFAVSHVMKNWKVLNEIFRALQFEDSRTRMCDVYA